MFNHAENRIGQQVGNYRLTRLLGQGGFAHVYLGEHLTLKTYAALKALRIQLTEKNLEAFLNEARTVACLNHPHIVQVLDYVVEQQTGIPFLIMNYAANGSVRQRYPRGSLLPLNIVCGYVQQVASALDYAHQKKFIHRDIKPENILLGRSNEVLLSDFGLVLLAQTTGSQTAKELAGTISYAAPEQLQGKPRPASDQYALGIVVYEWLCGELPFQGGFVEVGGQHLMVSPPPLHKRRPNIPPEVESVVFRALAKDPHQRFPTVKAFATALQDASQASLTPVPLLEGESSSTSNMDSLDSSSVSMSTNMPIYKPTRPANGFNLINPSRSSVNTPSSQFIPEIATATPSTPPSRPGSTSIPALFLRRNFKFLLIALAVLIILGSSGIYWTLRNFTTTPSPIAPGVQKTATTSASTSARCGSSSYPMYGFDLQHTHYNPKETCLSATNVSKLTLAWKAPTGDPTWSSPVLANNMVYIGSDDEMFHAFDVTTGNPRWSYFTNGPIRSAPMIANGIVYVAPNSPTLSAINASSGTLVWKVVLSSNITFSSPLVVNNTLYIGAADAKLYTFNASTGQQLWTTSLSNRIDSSPTYYKGVVYLTATDPTGKANNMYAINASTGRIQWTATLQGSSQSSPAIDAALGLVYVGSANGKLYAFNAAGCGSTRLPCPPVWSAQTNGAINSSAVVAKDIVYIGSHAGTLYAFSASNGNSIWSFSTGDGIYSTPTIANGVIYFGSEDHTIYALDASIGIKLWSYPTGNTVESSPAVVNGVVYVGSTDKYLYAFHLPNTKP